MKFLKNAALAITLIGVTSAHAASIDLEKAYYESSDSRDFKTVWDAIPETDKTFSTLTEFTSVDTGNNTLSKLSIDFFVGQATDIDFKFGLDGGYGAAVYLNDTLVTERIEDLWWKGNYNHSDVINTNFGTSSAGSYSLDVYWAEGWNSGPQSAQFTLDGGDNWLKLSVSNLESVSAVPEPSTYALMLGSLGLIGFMAARRRKQV